MARLPIYTFLRERLAEYDPSFEVREGSGFFELFIKPMQFIMQPISDEVSFITTDQSFLKILETDDPDAYNEEAVDNLAYNLFVERIEGGSAGGVARLYYSEAVNREWPTNGITIFGSNSLVYTNTSPFSISLIDMTRNLQDGLFYYDIPIECTTSGADSELEIDGLVSVNNDPDVILVRNPEALTGGADRESNIDLISRSKESIAVRDLVTGKGFSATIFENFGNFVTELIAIGFGDPEMMRDIVYNTHIGGRVDGYLKTANISTKTKNFAGIGRDDTRQSRSSKNVQMYGTTDVYLGFPHLDRTDGKDPIVRQVKASAAAEYLSTVDMAAPIDLSVNQYIGLIVDGEEKNIRVAGAIPSTTSRNEIVNKINASFGVNVCEPVGSTLRAFSLKPGVDSSLVIKDPVAGSSALLEVFGLAAGSTYMYTGDGPITFTESVHYTINDEAGTIARIVGPLVLPTQLSGETTLDSELFLDNSIGSIFDDVLVNDIITIESGDDVGDYRVLEVNPGVLTLDKALTATATSIEYSIRRTGIKDEELLYVEYYFNPISIDILKYIVLDEEGNRGIRPGRSEWTIDDVPFIRIKQIQVIDPVTGSPTGTILYPSKGWGGGVYGGGPYGIGDTGDYRFVVNSPHERFSVFEDSYIVFSTQWSGYSVQVEYDCTTELEPVHDFTRSYNERCLGSDILIKHFLPAYVDGTIEYKVDPSNSAAPDNETLQQEVIDFITSFEVGKAIQYSDIIQFIVRKTDPSDRYGGYVNPFTLRANIHNTNGTITSVTGEGGIEIPTLDPFPKDTDTPLSPSIAHWIGNNITLVRL